MPKCKPAKSCHLQRLVKEFGEDIFCTDGLILFCKVCEVKVAAEKKFTVTQHVGREKHIKGIEVAKKKSQASQLLFVQCSSSTPSKKSPFYKEMCDVLVSANISFEKLNNAKFRNFLEKHTGHVIPDESTVRKNYLQECYDETMDKIRNHVKDKKLFVSIDETNDVEGRPVANVIIGTLEPDCPGKIFLLNSEVLEKLNHSTICQLFDKSLNLLWPNGVEHNNVLLFLTDAAPYIVKAAKSIKSFYPKLVHVTCLAHALHRIAEEIRAHYPDIDRLVSNVKKIFLKSPYRIEAFKKHAPSLTLPPKPVITRWGTWLNACIYYSDNFETVKSIVNDFEPEDAASIQIAQSVLSQEKIEANLAYIKSNFGILSSSIKVLETQGMELVDAIGYIDKASEVLKKAKGKIGQSIIAKLNFVLEKNIGFHTLRNISDILTGEEQTLEIDEELSISESVFFKYAPITSVDVERSFSRFKNLLSDNRRSFTFDNLKKHLIIQCNSDVLETD